MDFLKKHYEKVALAVALLLVIASAVYLALQVEKLNEEGPSLRGPKGKVIERIDIGIYTNALAALKEPPSWASVPLDPFHTTPRGEPGPPPPPSGDTNPPPPICHIYMSRVVYKPFQL